MKAFHIACLWAASFITYAIILIAMYALTPQGILFSWYESAFGQVSGGEWDSLVGDFFIFGSAIINFSLVWLVAAIVIKRQRCIKQ